MKQQTALDIMKEGRNVFLTGAPGAGKTYVLNQYTEYLKAHDIRASITASTGIAASHIGGITLHSFAGLGITDQLDEEELSRILGKRHVVRRLQKVQSLVIDEISMVSPGVFRAVDTILRRIKVTEEPFGGVQVILSGDFFQLPPIAQSEDPDERYVWQTELWHQLDLTICYIHERHRHSDEAFINILDEIRAGEVSESSHATLEECYQRDLGEDRVTRLYTHNIDVDRINMEELAKLPGKTKVFRAGTKGNEKIVEGILSSTLVAPMCALKKNAVVIFIKNNHERGYVNGTLGVIVDFSPTTGLPLVRTFAGEMIAAEPEEWLREGDDGEVLAGVKQVPLRLAWALTVHKSQGMTIDAAEIDLSRSFEVGQGYVALSRVRSLDGLRLLGANEVALKVDERVITFNAEITELSDIADDEYSDVHEEQRAENRENFILATNGSIEEIPAEERELAGGKISTFTKTKQLLDGGLSPQDIAGKRKITLGTVVSHIERLDDEGAILNLDSISVPDDVQQQVSDVIKKLVASDEKEHLLENGRIRLRSVMDHLDEEISYETLRLAILVHVSRTKKSV